MEQKHHIVILLAESLLTWCLYTESICDCKPVHVVYVYISLSLPCSPDFGGKGGDTSLPPGGRPSSTVLYPGPPVHVLQLRLSHVSLDAIAPSHTWTFLYCAELHFQKQCDATFVYIQPFCGNLQHLQGAGHD